MSIRALPSKWGPVALVCRKCGKKLDGGFGAKGGRPLAKALRKALDETGNRRALRVAESGCLGLCPKNAVAVALNHQVLLVPKGCDMAELLSILPVPAGENVAPAAPEAATPPRP